MVSIREMAIANDIAEMAALGWFPHEFIVYGCCYVEDGKLYYKVSSQNTELYRFKEECLKRNIYVSPIVELLNRVSVPSGMQDEYLLRTKIKLAKRMQRDFDTDTMKQFSQLAEQDCSDSAAELLYNLKHKLLGCFERELLQLAESIVDYAFQQKKLKLDTYEDFCRWFDYVYSQMDDDIVIRKNFQRTFYGFAYKTSTGMQRYFVNASESEVRKKKEELCCQGIISTPILQKTYSFDNQPNLATVRESFLQQLKQWMDTEYMEYLDAIDQLPGVAAISEYNRLMHSAEGKIVDGVQKHIRYYLTMWNSGE